MGRKPRSENKPMIPSKKAKKLIDDMKGGCCRCQLDSKEAALTCCDEIITALNRHWDPSAENISEDKIGIAGDAQYWQYVKEEVNKL